ncbi:MAG: hypothetical protein JW809_18640 [Pirellulales bacterium]|nr:hypothetical protein [Pirellulales bacterium]
MNRPAHVGIVLFLVLAWLAPAGVLGQQDGGKAPYRAPAKGVMKATDSARQVDESFSHHDVVELLAVDAKFDWARDATFRRDIWSLKFEFKPLRMVWIDMPQESGKMQRKAIHYLVYSVTNVPQEQQKEGPPRWGWMHPAEGEDGKYTAEYQDKPIRFVPEFLLESPEYNKAYPDRVIPLAMPAIRAREDRRVPAWSGMKQATAREPLHNAVDMAREIAVGETVWGVATWEEIDPRIDRFTIYVQGLTNAYRWRDKPGQYAPGAPREKYRTLLLKTLKLNFWRPGDELSQEKALRRGYPGEPDYEWLYLPSLSRP